MRLRDTRMFCRMQNGSAAFPVVIRERNIKEDTFKALASVCALIFVTFVRPCGCFPSLAHASCWWLLYVKSVHARISIFCYVLWCSFSEDLREQISGL